MRNRSAKQSMDAGEQGPAPFSWPDWRLPTRCKFGLAGLLLGGGLPLLATWFEMCLQGAPLSLSGFLETQGEHRLLWIMDTTPLVLGGLGAFAGHLQDRLETLTARLHGLVAKRTRALQATNKRLAATLESAPDAIVTADAEGRIRSWNRSAERIFGHTEYEALGQCLTLIVPEALRGAHDDGIKRASAGGEHRVIGQTVEVPALHADGRQIPVELSIGTWESDGERLYGAILRDVSDRKEAEAARDQLQQQVEQGRKLESIGRLAAGIAHEINTPTQYVTDNVTFLGRALNGLVAAIEACGPVVEAACAGKAAPEAGKQAKRALRKAKVPFLVAQVPPAVAQAHEGLERVAKIVMSMKEFSHPSGGQKKHESLGPLIETTLTVARNELKYVADVVTEFDPDLPPVPVLRDELNQVILNIAVNAAHAISDVTDGGAAGKGTITVTTGRSGDYAEIRIRDTGSGIPEEVRKRIFEPFFTTKEVGKGTGQGLAIAHTVVVEKHGGELMVESEVGRGTTFIVRLPLVAPADDAGAEAGGAQGGDPSPQPAADAA